MKDEKAERQAVAMPGQGTLSSVSGECINMGAKLDKTKPRILLHSCCGPCSSVCIERLSEEYEVTVYFYNPNITDEDEYKKRKEAQLKLIKGLNDDPGFDAKVDFIEGPYDAEAFYKAAKDMEDEPEGGMRCGRCFELRLKKTAETAGMMNFDGFTTTLTVSPHKDYDVISSIGKRIGVMYGVGYVDRNFKKKDGFKRSIELSKKYGLYRQNYCGCEFSKWWKDEEKTRKKDNKGD